MAIKSQRVRLETKAFQKAIRNFRTVTRRKTGTVLKEVGKLVVRDAMSLTPPTKKGFVKAGKPAWAVHKKIGEGAIINDLLGKSGRGGIFRVRKQSTFNKAAKWQEKLGKDMAGMAHSMWATKDGRVFGVERDLYQPDASISTMKAHHKKYRGANGRVSRAGREDLRIGRWVFLDKMFVTPGRFKAYMKHLKKRVGAGKAGWNKAASKLKVSRPKWIKHHGMRGGKVNLKVNHPIFPTITVSNEISYMQKHGMKNNIMRKAIKSQTSNFKKRTKAAIQYAARKSKLKA